MLNAAASAPAPDTLHPRVSGGSSQVFAADGTRLGFIQSDAAHTRGLDPKSPPSSSTPRSRSRTSASTQHDGVDFTGIFRSAVKDVIHGSALQGGSTITMQLMRNLYLGGDQHTLNQKIVEAKFALDYEKQHSKRSILTDYLNSVPYGTLGGQTAVGVQAAARIFFDKPASELNLAAVGPARRASPGALPVQPVPDPHEARTRRNEVLAKMAQLHYISAAEAPARRARRARSPARELLLAAPRGLLLRIRPRAARQALRPRSAVHRAG